MTTQSQPKPQRKYRQQKNNPFVDADGSPLAEGDPVSNLQTRAEDDLARNVPPHSVDAEQAVLGGILLNPKALDEISELQPEDFYLPAHRLIYSACLTLYSEKNAPLDLAALGNYLKDHALLEESGGAAYLASLFHSTISSARVDYYASIVRDKAKLRALIRASSDIISSCFEPGLEARNILDEAEHSILKVAEHGTASAYKSSEDLAFKFIGDLQKRAQRKDALTGVTTGYAGINLLTGGFQPSDLIILAARTSVGKTALALNFALRAAVGDSTIKGVPVAIFSLEMAMDQLIGRMLCAWGRVDFMHLRHNKIPDEDWEGLKFAADALSKAEIYIDDTPALTVMELRARARRLEREKKIKLLVIDYLQLMRGTSRKADSSREQEISEISRGLKALAKELDIPIIALAQVNRDVEKRSDKRPMLSDLRESGAIEQDADLIMFIHRDAAYLKHDMRPARDIAEITVAKHRNGATGMVELMYTSAYTQFEEYVPSHHPSPAI